MEIISSTAWSVSLTSSEELFLGETGDRRGVAVVIMVPARRARV